MEQSPHGYEALGRISALLACGRSWAFVDFRHSVATEFTERSGNLLGVGYLLGRRHATTTDQYIHARRRAAESVLLGQNSGHIESSFEEQDSTMSDVRACARALVQRVADGGEIPIASLREIADLVLRSELVAVSHQLLAGPPEFALRRAMELSGLILAVVAKDDREKEKDAAK